MNNQISHIHDAFIKDILARKEAAADFFREYLPEHLIEAIDFETLTSLNTSYISSSLKTAYSDLLWSVKMKDQEKLQISLLLEHKSHIDNDTSFQLLEYLALAYRKQRKEMKKSELIIPILYYHGKNSWNFKPLTSFFPNLPDYLKIYLPEFHTEYINLNRYSAEQILRIHNGILSGSLMIQKYFFYPENLNSYFHDIVEKLRPYLNSNEIETIFVYLEYSGLNKVKLDEAIKNLPDDMSTRIITLREQLLTQGKTQGIAEGKAQGILEGKIQGIAESLQKTILNAFDAGIGVATIRIITGESEEKINRILAQNNRI
ncbi:Recombination-promoting nuclease RpnD [compost metagenome]